MMIARFIATASVITLCSAMAETPVTTIAEDGRTLVNDEPRFLIEAELEVFGEDSKETPEEPEQFTGLFGYWDAYISGSKIAPVKGMNVGKSMSRTVSPITRQEIKAITHIGGLRGISQDERKKRIRDTEGYLNDAVVIVHLEDEPLAHDITASELEELADYTRERLSRPAAVTINLTELKTADSFPQNMDYVFFQAYPYRDPSHSDYWADADIGDTKQDLFNDLDRRYKQLKEEMPDTKIGIVAQGFYGDKWRKPPAQALDWYAEWCAKNQIEVLLIWKYFDSGNWKGIESF